MSYNINDYVCELENTPLPPVLKFSESEIVTNSENCKAYYLATQLEQISAWPTDLPDDDHGKAWPTAKLTPQMASRLLGYMLIEAPVQEVANIVASEINGCSPQDSGGLESTDVLYSLAELTRFYALTLLKTFRTYNGKTPSLVSSSSSRSSSESALESRSDYMQSKKEALARDGHRCVLQGTLDTAYYESLSLSDRRALASRLEDTNAAHIIPHKLSTDQDKPIKSMCSSTIWSIFNRREDLRIDELQGEQINGLDNILTLSMNMHSFYNRMRIWFTHVEGNTYRVESTDGAYLFPVAQNPVTFTSTDPGLPLPNPEYLKFHRACARVYHLSGSDEYIKDVVQREELLRTSYKGRTLTSDNSLDLYEILASLQSTPHPIQ